MTYQCLISGKVQGVYYRSYVQEMASEAGFSGYVMNLSNGEVEACVTLKDEKELALFLDILKAGSPYSSVDHINTRLIDVKFSDGFMIYR
ncbi:MAG: acylphosphatase [Gammaproteobacteria bacterium]|nr:acylphosphatase [Gammaproteobacteria bacterium]